MIIDIILHLFTLEHLLMINIGLAAGIIVGALPGLTATMAIAILVPITYGLSSTGGVLLLLGVYAGAIYGGSITAILIKTPGTPSAAATVLDGYEMAAKGQAGAALDMALKASEFGGLFSAILLLFIAPFLAKLALKFGPPEYFALGIFGLSVISSVGEGSVYKGLLMGMLGLFATTVGMDPINGIVRLTFGIDALWNGINVIPAMIGLFAISEIMQKTKTVHQHVGEILQYDKTKVTMREFFRYWKTLVKSSIIGSFIGAIPGTGAAIAAFMSYNEAKRASKHPELFGTGYIEGVAAPEAANNAVTGSAMIPLLTLGIPGDSVTAILMGALIMKGIIPGPQLFVENTEWVYLIMIGFVFINIFMYLQGKLFIKAFVNITKLPTTILIPMLAVLCVVGSYAVNNNISDVFIMLIFGLLAYFLTRYKFPITPMVIAIVLGPLVEQNLRRSLIISEGSSSIFFTRPISLIFLGLSIFIILYPLVRRSFKTFKR
jgi:putative tricarboxylic transport membrane protein